MKFSAILSIAALAQVSLADFYIYRVRPGNEWGYQISESGTPQCDELGPNTPWYGAKVDVSGNTRGVRCEGHGCNEGVHPKQVNLMEMHFSNTPKFHWTIRKNQNYDLIALDGAVQGRCYPDPGFTFFCPSRGLVDHGDRKFHCRVYASAAQIKGAK